MLRYGVNLEAIRCRVRQRTVQYELLEINQKPVVPQIKWVVEVVSPVTGVFSPIQEAMQSGWLVSDESGEYYVDTEAKQRIPLDVAVSKGLVRLGSPSEIDKTGEYHSLDSHSLLLIERITFAWCPVRITSYLDTLSNIQVNLNEALQKGWIQLKTGEPVILDRASQRRITTEEAAGRGVVQIVPVDPSERFCGPLDETYSFRVFCITSVCPGGESDRWLEPTEAAKLGLFNWRTGEVAAEWNEFVTERDQPHPSLEDTRQYVPTKWLSLLEARKARWVRLRVIAYPNEILQEQPPSPLTHSPHRILSTHVHLIAPKSIPVVSSRVRRTPASSTTQSGSGINSPNSTPPMSYYQSPQGVIIPVQSFRSSTRVSPSSPWPKLFRSARNPEQWSRPSSYSPRYEQIQESTQIQTSQRIYRSFVSEPSNRLLVEWEPIDSLT